MASSISPNSRPPRVHCLFEGGSKPTYRLPILSTLARELEEGRSNREALVRKLPPSRRDECLKVLKSVDEIVERLQQIFEASGNEIEEKKSAFESYIDKLVLDPSSFDDHRTYLKLAQEEFPYGDIFFIKDNSFSDHLIQIETSLNIFINKASYQNEINEFIHKYKDEIIRRFSQDSNPNTLEFEIKPIKEGKQVTETHHGGKSPRKIEFTRDSKLVFTVIYKPRAAELDRKVIETFQKINASKGQETHKYTLPTYQIWARGEASIWEYIPGESMKEGGSLKDALMMYPRKNSALEKESLDQLDFLDAVLNEMRIGDLHHQNAILENEANSGELLRLIPIDLENYRPEVIYGRFSTGLKGDPRNIKLSKGVLKIIREFKEEVEPKIPFRYVVLDTREMMKFVGIFSQARDLAVIFHEQLQGHKIQEVPSLPTLQSYIETDILNGDVPYFTENNGIVYYGMHTNGLVLGKVPTQ